MNRLQLQYVILLALLHLFHRLVSLYLLVVVSMSGDGHRFDYVLTLVHLHWSGCLIRGLDDTRITLTTSVIYVFRVHALAVFHGHVVFVGLAT